MESPLFLCWKNNPDHQYKLGRWANNGDHERVVLVDAATGKEHEATLDDVSFNDPTAPDLLQALKIMRDFQRHEMSRVRRGPPKSRDRAYNTFDEMFLDLFNEMIPTGSSTSTLGCSGRGPVERRLHAMQANWHKSLDDLPEDLRDAKTCAIAVERDILQYAYVPELYRTEEMGKTYLVAKRAKRKRDEEEAAEAENKAKVDAAAEETKANRRAAEKAKRDAKKDNKDKAIVES